MADLITLNNVCLFALTPPCEAPRGCLGHPRAVSLPSPSAFQPLCCDDLFLSSLRCFILIYIPLSLQS